MRFKTICLPACLLFVSSFKPQPSFKQFTENFVKTYSSFKIPAMDMSYVSNLKKVGSRPDIQQQTAYFESVKASLKNFSVNKLADSQKTDYELIAYETDLNLERLALWKQWAANPPKEIPIGGIYNVPNGKAWYAYFLKDWLSADVTPDEIFKSGLSEVERVKGHIEAIRKQTGLTEDAFYQHLNDKSFFIRDPANVLKAFEHTQSVIYSNMGKVFNARKIPPLKIEQGANQQLAQTPGYYDQNVFYYNQFGKPYNKRQVDWLFIHEAVPGHHYKSSINSQVKQSAVQQIFYFLGLEEGWGAYVEELGKDLGVYKTPYDELGKWEWDIVRSVRVPMDIGLNYYGWTDQQALAFWKKNIKNQDDIAMREIARVKRWPAQCITYKYGARQIMQWKEQVMKREGVRFDIRNFHDRILNLGSLPVFMVGERVVK